MSRTPQSPSWGVWAARTLMAACVVAAFHIPATSASPVPGRPANNHPSSFSFHFPVHQHHQRRTDMGLRKRLYWLSNVVGRSLRDGSGRRQDAMMNDPRFVSCMDDTSGPEDPNFMTVFAKCYSFAGRPRFGKRSSFKTPYTNRAYENWLERNPF